MVTFKSPEVIVNRTAESFFKKIEDLNNLKEIMPAEVDEFSSDKNTCSIKMKGMPKIELEIGEKVEYSKISLIAKGSHIPFSLYCYITEKKEQCQARLEINAEINMMMKMMVEKPLTKFLDLLASRMQNI